MTKFLKHQVLTIKDLPQVLVAGGAGFIGSHLCQLLLAQNCQVICLDNLTTGKKESINHLLPEKNFQLLNSDLTQPLDKLDLPIFDYIFHLAGIESHLSKDKNSGLKTLMVNSLGTRNLLELAKKDNSKFLLGSSIHVFEGVISNKELTNYFGKPPAGQNFYSLAEAKRFSETLTFEYFKYNNLNSRIVRIFDVYGPGMPLKTNNPINSLIDDLISGRSLRVAGDGLKLIYPTFVDDCSLGLLKAMFNQDSNGKIYTLANPEEITLLNFSHLLRKDSGFLATAGIEFVELDQHEKIEIEKKDLLKTKEELNWQPKVGLEDGIKKTLSWLDKTKGKKLEEDEKVATLKTQNPPAGGLKTLKNSVSAEKFSAPALPEKPKRQNILSKIFKKIKSIKKPKLKDSLKILVLILILSFIILFTPIISFFYYFNSGISQFKQQRPVIALAFWQRAKRVVLDFGWLSSFGPFREKKNQLVGVLNLGIMILETQEKQQLAEKRFNDFINIVIKGERGDLNEAIKDIAVNLEDVWQKLSLLESELGKINWEDKSLFGLTKIKDDLKSFYQDLPALRKQIALSKEGVVFLPQLLGFNDKKTYLILIQDNFELRPAGGFLNFYGLLSFEKGKLLDFSIDDVNNADNELKGHIEPPVPIKKYLAENNWYLRDANWETNFPSSANQTAWFLKKELGKETNGTIGLTYDFIKNLLTVTGPIQLSQANETISADNFLEKNLSYAEVNFSTVAGGKKFLPELIESIFAKIKTLKANDWLVLLKTIEQGFKEKQLLVSLGYKPGEEFLNRQGWDGSVRQQVLGKTGERVSDYLMISEANLGVNKANYFLKRQLDQAINILDDGKVRETLTITYNNVSALQGWPAGEYKNYLRLYMPLRSELIKVALGEEKNNLITLSSNKIDYSEEYGKQAYGLLVVVPVQGKRIVQISYQLKEHFDFNKTNLSYLMFWQKQPGTEADQLTLKLNLPAYLKPVKISPIAQLGQAQINFSTNLGQDRVFLVDLKK